MGAACMPAFPVSPALEEPGQHLPSASVCVGVRVPWGIAGLEQGAQGPQEVQECQQLLSPGPTSPPLPPSPPLPSLSLLDRSVPGRWQVCASHLADSRCRAESSWPTVCCAGVSLVFLSVKRGQQCTAQRPVCQPWLRRHMHRAEWWGRTGGQAASLDWELPRSFQRLRSASSICCVPL